MPKVKYRVYKTTFHEGSYSTPEWFRLSLEHFSQMPDADNIQAWDYVQIVPIQSYKAYYCGNDGAQGWRHKDTGLIVPDYCRQSDGTPEVWTPCRKRQLSMHPDSPVLDYIVLY